MVRLRAEKVHRVIKDIPPVEVIGEPEGDILLVGWGIARPIVRMLTAGPTVEATGELLPAGNAGSAGIAQLTYGEKVAAARQLVDMDAERVAGIVKGWVGADG